MGSLTFFAWCKPNCSRDKFMVHGVNRLLVGTISSYVNVGPASIKSSCLPAITTLNIVFNAIWYFMSPLLGLRVIINNYALVSALFKERSTKYYINA